MPKQRVRGSCTVCGRRAGTLTPYRGIALLCPLHATVVRGIIPQPATAAAVRALFPERVTARAGALPGPGVVSLSAPVPARPVSALA